MKPTELSALLEKYGQRIRDNHMGRIEVMRLTGLGDSAAKRLLKLVDAEMPGRSAVAGTRKVHHSEYAEGATESAPAPGAERISVDQQGDGMTVECPKGRISTPEELLQRAGIDERVWKVDRVQLNNWEMGSAPRRTGNDKDGWSRESNEPNVTPLFSIKLWLSRRTDVLDLLQMKEDALAEIRAASPAPLQAPPRSERGQLLYLGAHDVHVGAFADASETRQAYTIEQATTLARTSIARLLDEAGRHGIGRILLPVGHDLTHVDSSANMTTRGTPQDMDGRYRSMRRYAYELMVRLIEHGLEYAPVDVEAVPGNHGRETDLAIAERLEARFHNHPHVTVRVNLHPRPYYVYGTNLLGLTHGDGVKGKDLPLVMADEMPQAWATTTHREWLLGHYHKKQTMQVITTEDEYRAVRVRHLPSIKALDYYHAAAGYSNLRAMEAYRYDLEDGYCGHHSVTVKP